MWPAAWREAAARNAARVGERGDTTPLPEVDGYARHFKHCGGCGQKHAVMANPLCQSFDDLLDELEKESE